MINPMQLEGRVILVTGASSGIGRDTAILLSQMGARLVLVARDTYRLEETKSSLEGSDHIGISKDLCEVDDFSYWLKILAGDVGPFHGLVHCAGKVLTAPLRLSKDEDIDGLFHINIKAAILLVKAFRQRDVYAPGSSIVLLSSIGGLTGQPGLTLYSATKGALNAFCRSCAIEFARDGIRVNCVAPGHITTEMTDGLQKQLTTDQLATIERLHPLGIGHVRDVAMAVAFLLADTGRWITGTTLVVDGGYTAQ